MSDRIIIHVDMDAFFAAVEVLDHPELRGKAVIVGGGATRGVVSASSYEARKFGVYSAMPMAQAIRLCPHAVVLPVNFARYRDVSTRIMSLLGQHTPLFEPVSIDEAYLDVTHWLPVAVTGPLLAEQIQQEILQQTGLTCSLGVATGKAIAKMASDLHKPNGLVIVPPGREAEFLAPLAIGKLRGVGEATEKRLSALGVRTIGDLAQMQEAFLLKRFGVAGRDLLRLAQGIDDSPVVPEHQAKSMGREVTFHTDISDRHHLERVLLELSDDVAASLRRQAMLARAVTLKLRYDDFSTFTRSQTLTEPTDVTQIIYQQALQLFRQHILAHPVRLIGVTAGPLLALAEKQLSLFTDTKTEKQQKVDSALDLVRARFGADAIQRARLTSSPGEKEKREKG